MIPPADRGLAYRRTAGACGILGSTLTPILILSSTAFARDFSWGSNALSDLGVGGQALLFNGALVLGGVLNLLFAAGLRGDLGKDRSSRAGISLVVASSVCLSLIGIFTTRYLLVHAAVALGYMVVAPAGILLIGSARRMGPARGISFVLGIAALSAVLVLPLVSFALGLEVGFGVMEFLEILTISAWTFYMSAGLLGVDWVNTKEVKKGGRQKGAKPSRLQQAK